MHQGFKQRVGCALVAVLCGALVGACGGGDGGEDGDSGAVTSINVTLANHPWADQIKAAAPEFEKATGIKADVAIYDDEQLAQLFNIKLNAGSDEIDVMMFRPLQDSLLMAKNGWLVDLTDRVGQNAEWDWEDFMASSRDSVTVDGKVIAVPVATETAVLFYRKDLVEEAGLEVPKTTDELKAAVEAVQKLHPDIYAFAGRGEKSAAVTQFSSFLYGFGGEWVDENGDAAVDTPEALEAFNYYGGLLHDYGPPGSFDMNWPQVMGLMQQGLVAFYPEGSSQYNNAVDPTKSNLSDQIGVAPIPAGPAGEKPYNITNFAIGVNEGSAKQDAAWQFIEWATSAENVLTFQQNDVPGPRTSVWNDPAGTSTMAADLLEVIQHNGSIGVGHDRPVLIQVAAAREIVGTPIVTAIQGGDVAAAAKEANPKFQALLDEDGL
jgi:multiple sugar transport system substrate-binding protein